MYPSKHQSCAHGLIALCPLKPLRVTAPMFNCRMQVRAIAAAQPLGDLDAAGEFDTLAPLIRGRGGGEGSLIRPGRSKSVVRRSAGNFLAQRTSRVVWLHSLGAGLSDKVRLPAICIQLDLTKGGFCPIEHIWQSVCQCHSIRVQAALTKGKGDL